MADAAPAAKPADEAMDGDVRSNGPSEVPHFLLLCSFLTCLACAKNGCTLIFSVISEINLSLLEE